MSAKCSDSNGYYFKATIGSYSSMFADSGFVFDDMSKKFKKDMLEAKPNGCFEVVSFNRV